MRNGSIQRKIQGCAQLNSTLPAPTWSYLCVTVAYPSLAYPDMPCGVVKLRAGDEEGLLADRHGRRGVVGRVYHERQERYPGLRHVASRGALGGRQGHRRSSGEFGFVFFCCLCGVCILLF